VAVFVAEKVGGDVPDADDAVAVADAVAAGEAVALADGLREREAGTVGVPVRLGVVLALTKRVMEAVEVGDVDAVPAGVPAGEALAVAAADAVWVADGVAGGGMAQTSVSCATVWEL
jgi:hypothetical protein